MIPRTPLLVAFGMALVPMALGVWVPWLGTLGWVANVLVLLVAVFDWARSPWPGALELEREVAEVLSVGVENPVTLCLVNRSRGVLDLWVTDGFEGESHTEGLPVRLQLPPGKKARATYRICPMRRGSYEFREIFARYSSVWGLWTFDVRRTLVTAVRVYPDIRGTAGFDLLAKRNQMQELGLKLWRLRGREGEFERLRAYRRGDELRAVDWKATAKRQELISREYTVERNQNIMFLMDCGRSMRNEVGGVVNLDRSLNASLMLSYIALGQGDNVGLIAFSNKMERVVPAVRGQGAIKRLIRNVYDLEASWETSDYALACEFLLSRQRKRALVVLLTYVLDEQHLAVLGAYVRSLARNHLFLCVLLQDTTLVDLADRMPTDDVQAFESAAAAELLEGQSKQVARLRESGVLVLETRPDQLTSDLINQYLDLKARHLL